MAVLVLAYLRKGETFAEPDGPVPGGGGVERKQPNRPHRGAKAARGCIGNELGQA